MAISPKKKLAAIVAADSGRLRKTARVAFRLAPERLELYLASAKKAGLDFTTWVIQQIDKGVA